MSRLMCIALLPGLLVATGCEQKPAERMPAEVTSEDVRRDAGQAAHTAVEFSKQTKEEFQQSLEARLKSLDAEIAKLREKGRGLQDEARANWDRKMTELETKREAASARLAEVGQSSAEAWKDVRQGAQSAWEDLDKAFREAAREFESSAKPN